MGPRHASGSIGGASVRTSTISANHVEGFGASDPDGSCDNPASRRATSGNATGESLMRMEFLALALLATSAGAESPASATAVSPHCGAAEYHQLDYWIGDWDTFETDTPAAASVARARVERIAQGCAIHELYEQVDGLIGDSILSYDPVRKQWQQTWVTNRGSIMVIVGNVKDGALILEGEAHLKDGKSVMQRITWKPHEKGVRESAVLSKDGGKTWVQAFDVLFVKHVDGG
jgi:hypothetical protein